MSELASRIANNFVNGQPAQPQPNTVGLKMGQVDELSVFWENLSRPPAGSDKKPTVYLSGMFGGARWTLFPQTERQSDTSPHWFSSLSDQQTEEQKAAGVYPPRTRFMSFWEEKAQDGTIYLSSVGKKPTEFAVGHVYEIWPITNPVANGPKWRLKVRQKPRKPKTANSAPANGTTPAQTPPADQPPTNDQPTQEPAMAGAGTGAGGEDIPF